MYTFFQDLHLHNVTQCFGGVYLNGLFPDLSER